jgi:glycosyltransferase involved in cell wall biosynthesis
MEKVAILLAVYNGERYLSDLLHSLMEQTYTDFKVYIRDNCSSDGTLELLEEWKQRHPHKIELFVADSNKGCISNFSALMNCTLAPYVMFCDHDDVWLPNKIALTLAKMDKLESIHGPSYPIAVHTDLSVVDAELNVVAPSMWKAARLNTSDNCYAFSRLLVQNQLTGCTLMMNRALVDLAKPIPPQCVMHDWWVALVASCFGTIGAVRQPTILYRQHGSNESGAKSYTLFSYLKRLRRARIKAKLPEDAPQIASPASCERAFVDRKIEQAEIFLNRYQNMLSIRDTKTAVAYLKMQKASFFGALALILRYRFFKTGILRNFILNH